MLWLHVYIYNTFSWGSDRVLYQMLYTGLYQEQCCQGSWFTSRYEQKTLKDRFLQRRPESISYAYVQIYRLSHSGNTPVSFCPYKIYCKCCKAFFERLAARGPGRHSLAQPVKPSVQGRVPLPPACPRWQADKQSQHYWACLEDWSCAFSRQQTQENNNANLKASTARCSSCCFLHLKNNTRLQSRQSAGMYR